jgi:hypothetical protein
MPTKAPKKTPAKKATAKKAVIVVHPVEQNGAMAAQPEFMWTLELNGRPYAIPPVTYTRHAAAVDSANRFADMLAFRVLVITQSEPPDA